MLHQRAQDPYSSLSKISDKRGGERKQSVYNAGSVAGKNAIFRGGEHQTTNDFGLKIRQDEFVVLSKEIIDKQKQDGDDNSQ